MTAEIHPLHYLLIYTQHICQKLRKRFSKSSLTKHKRILARDSRDVKKRRRSYKSNRSEWRLGLLFGKEARESEREGINRDRAMKRLLKFD